MNENCAANSSNANLKISSLISTKHRNLFAKILPDKKQNRQNRAALLLEKIDRIEAVEADRSGGNFKLKNVERAGANVLTIEDLAIGYGEKILGGKNKFYTSSRRNARRNRRKRNGKTTFLKTVLGKIRELDGKMIWGAKTIRAIIRSS